MNLKKLFPLVALLGGVVAGGLRLGQQQTGFDGETGLSVAGNGYALGLLALAVVCVVFSVVAGRGLKTKDTSYVKVFLGGTMALSCMVLGIFIVIASGVWMGIAAFGVSQLDLMVSCGVVLGGVGLLGIVPACRAGSTKTVDSVFALLAVVAAVVLLIVCYRQVAINPVLWDYGVEVLALSAVLLALFHLVGFGFGMGKPHHFCGSATMAIVLCGAMLADGLDLGMTLYFAGNGILLLGFLLAQCWQSGKRIVG
ncbi:hypothetical protein RFF05_03230 [Bengtsoniella intestinalis]|uniref:hypothetical protein n=1 Tax=Bengtsoniella intestinalis TaxID=3073143 RepID=UPI00391FBD89